MRIVWTSLIAVLCALLIVPTTGCTKVTQAQINSAVTDVANWAPVISSDATALLSDIASFNPSDAAAIQSAVNTINTDSAALTTACKQYLAAPSSSILTQISGLVSELATTDSQALLSVLQIKDANSQLIAKGILTTIATAVTILSGYLSSINVAVTPVVSTALRQLRPYADRGQLQMALVQAKQQGLAPQNLTLAEAGF